MASRNENESACISSNTSTVCPICFENFKYPRYLPCFHTFCSDCLLSYIVTACKQKEAPVGFQCPICRIFVPAPVFPALPEKWLELIPVNKTIQALVAKGDDKRFCDVCKREDEEEIATDWCKACMETLCESCRKYHKKNLTSREHKVIPLTTLTESTVNDVDRNETLEDCRIHQEKIKYFCEDHQETCCMHCVCTEHRTCRQVVTVEKQAQNLKELQNVNKLVKKIQRYVGALDKAKTCEENNMEEINKASDALIKQSTELKTKLMTHMDVLFEKHVNDLSRVTKESRKKLTESIESFSDRQLLADSYVQTLESIKEGGSSVALVAEYYKIKKHIFKVAEAEISQIEFHLKQDIHQKLLEILPLSTFANITLGEQSKKFDFNINTYIWDSLNVICELDNSAGEITGGCFLPNGDVLLVDTDRSELAYYQSDGKFVKKISLSFYPDDLTLKDLNLGTLFITCSYWKEGQGIYSATLSKYKTKLMKGTTNTQFQFHEANKCYGITCKSGFIYVACDTVILKINSDGEIMLSLKTEEKTYSVAVNKHGNIISSSCSSHSVTSVKGMREKLFRYTHPELNFPYGLDVDYEDFIYVAGRNSNNIHILSPSGKLIKMIETPKPNCIKFKKDSRVCFIGSYESCKTKLCEFRE